MKAAKEKRLSYPIRDSEHRKKRLLNRPGGFFDRRPLRVLALALLLSIIAAPSLLPKFSVVDNDIWWHLKAGDWILEHSAFPRTGILSRTAADRPWMAYSWIYEVLLSFFHSKFHLMGIAVYGLLLTLAVTYSVFWMTRRLSGRFWGPSLLATLCCAAFLFKIYPRPAFFSMMFFAISVTLLLEARRTGRLELLYWLPPLFLVWANTHVQFIYGLFAAGLFVTLNLVQDWASHRRLATDFFHSPLLPSRTLLVLLGASVLATCVGPYSYHLYSVIFNYATAKFPYAHIAEFQAFRLRTLHRLRAAVVGASCILHLGAQETMGPFSADPVVRGHHRGIPHCARCLVHFDPGNSMPGGSLEELHSRAQRDHHRENWCCGRAGGAHFSVRSAFECEYPKHAPVHCFPLSCAGH